MPCSPEHLLLGFPGIDAIPIRIDTMQEFREIRITLRYAVMAAVNCFTGNYPDTQTCSRQNNPQQEMVEKVNK